MEDMVILSIDFTFEVVTIQNMEDISLLLIGFISENIAPKT